MSNPAKKTVPIQAGALKQFKVATKDKGQIQWIESVLALNASAQIVHVDTEMLEAIEKAAGKTAKRMDGSSPPEPPKPAS